MLYVACVARYMVSGQVGIVLNAMKLDDYTIDICAEVSTKLTSIASSAMSIVQTFGVKNIVTSLLWPGSLSIVTSDISSPRLSSHALHIAREAHAILSCYGAQHNQTLRRELRKSDSMRQRYLPRNHKVVDSKQDGASMDAASRRHSARSSSWHEVSPAGPTVVPSSLVSPAGPTVVPLSVENSNKASRREAMQCFPRHIPHLSTLEGSSEAWATRPPAIRVDGTRPSRVQTLTDAHDESSTGCVEHKADNSSDHSTVAMVSVRSELGPIEAIQQLAAQLSAFQQKTRGLPTRCSPSLVAQVERTAKVCTTAVVTVMTIMQLTAFAVDKNELVRVQIAQLRQHELRLTGTLSPRISAMLISHARLRLFLRVSCNSVWAVALLVAFLIAGDRLSSPWWSWLVALSHSAVVLSALSLNLHLVKQIATTF
jgi:hypothetical protein